MTVGYPHEESPFALAVRRELERARGLPKLVATGGRVLREGVKGHAPINSAHEGYAVIFEELWEFWQHCLLKRENRCPAAMLKELVQVAAMAQRTAEDLGFIAKD